jgi:acyl dehydratase
VSLQVKESVREQVRYYRREPAWDPGGRAFVSPWTRGTVEGRVDEKRGRRLMAATSNSEGSDVWPNGAPEVGQSAELSRLVRPEYIELFSEVSGDYNPVHYDEKVARASPFGEIIVQGGVTSSILNAVVAKELPGPGTVFLQLDLSFKAPVRPGDTITGWVEVTDVRLDKPITKLDVAVRRDDDVVVLEGTAVCFTATP